MSINRTGLKSIMISDKDGFLFNVDPNFVAIWDQFKVPEPGSEKRTVLDSLYHLYGSIRGSLPDNLSKVLASWVLNYYNRPLNVITPYYNKAVLLTSPDRMQHAAVMYEFFRKSGCPIPIGEYIERYENPWVFVQQWSGMEPLFLDVSGVVLDTVDDYFGEKKKDQTNIKTIINQLRHQIFYTVGPLILIGSPQQSHVSQDSIGVVK